MSKRPPVPKFSETISNQLSQPQLSLLEDVHHLIIKLNLNQEVEKRIFLVLKQLKLPNTHQHAEAVVYFAMKDLNQQLPKLDKKVEYLVKCIEVQQNNLITTLCLKLKMNRRATFSCQTMLSQISHFMEKLPRRMQNAIAVKITSDIIYYHQGGINAKIIANHANIMVEQLQCCLNRIQPFVPKIIQNFFEHFKQLSE